jgi:hypothetical protein
MWHNMCQMHFQLMDAITCRRSASDLHEQEIKLMLLMKQALRNFLLDEGQIDWQ